MRNSKLTKKSASRIGIVSDIHGNIVSFESVLRELERKNVSELVCLGDVVQGGPAPSQVLQKLRELSCPVVAGNADEEVLSANAPRTYPSEFHQKLHDVDEWSLSKLNSKDIDFVKSFQPVVEIPLGSSGRTMLSVHGSPRSNREGMFPITSEQDLAKMLAGVTASIVACGHTHSQMSRRYIQSKVIINPGSVGLPFDFDTIERFTQRDAYNPAYAEYAVVNYSSDGQFDVELSRCPVDLQELTNSYLTSGMPHAQLFSHDWRIVQ